MIEIEEGDYIVGFWFAHDNEGNDWMGFVKKPKDSKLFKGTYRFRIRVDDNLDYTTQDKKRWTYFSSKDENQTEESIIDIMFKMQIHLQDIYPKIDVMLVQGDLEKMMEKAKTKSWMNIETMPTDEAKEKGII